MFSYLHPAALVLGHLVLAQAATTYFVEESLIGSSFFDKWDFRNGTDPNFGNVLYQAKDAATQQGLIGVNGAGNVVVKLDNTTDGTGNDQFGRPSVYLTSQFTFAQGNLLIFDAVHLPFGCSVWPAFWTLGTGGQDNWPNAGEIDIIEGVNLQQTNNINLHTLDGCQHPDNATSSSLETGTLVSTDCFNQTNHNQGCKVEVTGNSFGDNFNNNGGGVYALEWTDAALSAWFFPRGSVPSDVSATSSSPDPSTWGLPMAYYPTTSCDFSKFFSAQTVILNINICGSFGLSAFSATCSGSCLDLVQHPANYDNAFYEISYMRVFTNDSSKEASTSTSAGSSSTGSSTGSGSSPAQTTSSSTVSVREFSSILSLLAVIAFMLFN